jgi:hypothetical protein
MRDFDLLDHLAMLPVTQLAALRAFLGLGRTPGGLEPPPDGRHRPDDHPAKV